MFLVFGLVLRGIRIYFVLCCFPVSCWSYSFFPVAVCTCPYPSQLDSGFGFYRTGFGLTVYWILAARFLQRSIEVMSMFLAYPHHLHWDSFWNPLWRRGSYRRVCKVTAHFVFVLFQEKGRRGALAGCLHICF